MATGGAGKPSCCSCHGLGTSIEYVSSIDVAVEAYEQAPRYNVKNLALMVHVYLIISELAVQDPLPHVNASKCRSAGDGCGRSHKA